MRPGQLTVKFREGNAEQSTGLCTEEADEAEAVEPVNLAADVVLPVPARVIEKN